METCDRIWQGDTYPVLTELRKEKHKHGLSWPVTCHGLVSLALCPHPGTPTPHPCSLELGQGQESQAAGGVPLLLSSLACQGS